MSLVDPILFGTLEEVQEALKAGSDIEEVDVYGFTPLIEAAIANKTDVAALLLKSGADANGQDASGRTALHWAIDNANLELSQLLLKHNAEPNMPTTAGQPALIYPILRQQNELKKLLCDYGASLNFAQDFINAKLLGHRYELAGKVDIFYPKGQGSFIELKYEGFFLEFTIDIICHSLQRYSNHFSARHLQPYFPYLRLIIEAFIRARTLLKYQRYTIDIQQYADQIDPLLTKNLLLLPVAYEGHAISFIQYKNFLVRCDRGENSRREGSVVLYQIGNMKNWNLPFIKQLIYKRQTQKFITQGIKRVLGLTAMTQLPLASQLIGNCSWANVEASIPALLFLLLLPARNFPKSCEKDKAHAIDFYRNWMQWDKDRALEECIKGFQYASRTRKASKATILAAILFQTCDYQRSEDMEKAERILKILTLSEYDYLLKSYKKIYWDMRKTKQGLNFLHLLDVCGVSL